MEAYDKDDIETELDEAEDKIIRLRAALDREKAWGNDIRQKVATVKLQRDTVVDLWGWLVDHCAIDEARGGE